jgi:diguanylate cyclase (GGDEF)-like protein
MKIVVERRIPPDSGLAAKLASPLRISRMGGWKMAQLGLGLIYLADAATGPDLWFGPFYLLVIALAAWSLGWLEATAIGFASLGLTLFANGPDLYPGTGAAGGWNIGVRVLAVLMLIGLLHTVRQMYAREWRLSRTDPLTGALNRKAFFEVTSLRKSSRGWSVLVYCDLDGFKLLNDTAGHAAGDLCLLRFAQGIAKAIRKGDVFARVGGDEFAIYLDVKDKAAAKAVAARLHAMMNVLLTRHFPVRCSLGALILAPGRRSIDAEIAAADRLMYEAKQIGASLAIGTANERGRELTIERDPDRATVAAEPVEPPASAAIPLRAKGPEYESGRQLEEVA